MFWFILKAAFFNNTLRAATAGSVRMNLTYPLLKTLKIPIPPLTVQQKVVAYWKAAQIRYAEAMKKSSILYEEVEKDFLEVLGLVKPKRTILPKLMTVFFKDISRWSVMYNKLAIVCVDMTAGRYPTAPLQECLEDMTNGYCIRPVKQKTAHKMLKLNALQPNGLDLTETKYVKVSNEIGKRFQIAKGDLLICRSVGSYSHIAKCAIVTEDHPDIVFPDIIIRVRFNKKILPAYAREVIQSSIGRAWFQQNARTAVGMWKIGGSDINEFPMPLPELSIQRKLVDEISNKRQIITALITSETQKFHQANIETEQMVRGFRNIEDI